jgi:penicillin-binding protein 1C
LLIAIFAILMFPQLGFRAAVVWLPLPEPPPPRASTVLLDRDGDALLAQSAADGQWRFPLTYDQTNADLINAVIAVEDSRFYEHAGVDWRSVAGATWEDLTHFSIRRGASTITMQLARLRDPMPRTFFAKLRQAIHAEQIERRLDKRAIVVEYLNRAPFGGNLVGAGAASWRYFGKSCSQLSLSQCALLAGLPQSPNRLRPDRFPDRARIRRDHVLNRMLALHVISLLRHDEALSEPIDAKWLPLPQDAPELRDGARGPLASIAQRFRAQTTRTTLSRGIETQAIRIARQKLDELQPCGVDSSAVVVLDTRTAELLAAVSLSTSAPDADLTRSPRSTGSVLKPLIYTAAFDAGVCAPQTVLDDAPGAWTGYSPANYDRRFRGQLTAAEALAESRNLPAMQVLSRVGVSHCVQVMSAMGLATLSRTPDRYGLPLAIGGAEATPMEIAEAYATLARGGHFLPVAIRQTGSAGASRCQSSVLLRDACFAALAAIADPDRTDAACQEARRSNVAWKTGTSSGHRDAWCAAVTQRYTVVFWFGNAMGRGSVALVGADAAAPAVLALIASIDPIDDPWPATHLSDLPVRMHDSREALAIVSPPDGSELIVTRERQHRIALRTARGQANVWWLVDGTSIGRGQNVEWMPTLGTHEIRLLDDTGHSAVARVRVR